MIIDCHGHYTTAPQQLQDYRDAQIAHFKDPSNPPPAWRTSRMTKYVSLLRIISSRPCVNGVLI